MAEMKSGSYDNNNTVMEQQEFHCEEIDHNEIELIQVRAIFLELCK